MKKHIIFIRSVLFVFGALVVSRVPAFVEGNADPVLLVSTIVEAAFVIWGLVVVRK
jgi:hypothetical protein